MADEPLNNEQINTPASVQDFGEAKTGSETSNIPPEPLESPRNTDIPASVKDDFGEAKPKTSLAPSFIKI